MWLFPTFPTFLISFSSRTAHLVRWLNDQKDISQEILFTAAYAFDVSLISGTRNQIPKASGHSNEPGEIPANFRAVINFENRLLGLPRDQGLELQRDIAFMMAIF